MSDVSYPQDTLTEKERELRDWLITQPGGAEWWFVVKSGFRRSYDMGLRDASKAAPKLSAEMPDVLAQAMLDGHRARIGFDPIPLDDCAAPEDYRTPADALAPLIAEWLADAEARGERKALQQGRPMQRWIDHGRTLGRAEAVVDSYTGVDVREN